MIQNALGFLRQALNGAFPGDPPGDPGEDLFVFPGKATDGSIAFKSNSVSMLLVRIEEDPALRQPDPYAGLSADGLPLKVQPEVRMNLYILFVAPVGDDYQRSLLNLSRVVGYFQNHRVFNHENSPDLNDDISQLVLELITTTFSEQNEIWGTLRMAYQPSALYKLRLIVFRDGDGKPLTKIKKLIRTVTEMP